MSSYNPIVPMQGKEAAADLPQYRLVKDNGSGKHVLTAAKTDDIEGATMDEYATGQDTVLYTGGSVEKLTASAPIGAGVEIMPAADGKIQEADAVGGSKIIGKTLYAAGADGVKVICLMYDRPFTV